MVKIKILYCCSVHYGNIASLIIILYKYVSKVKYQKLHMRKVKEQNDYMLVKVDKY